MYKKEDASKGRHSSTYSPAEFWTEATSQASGQVSCMPSNVEGLLVLVFFVAPGFVASLVKNRLVPFSAPSPFREAVESVVLSVFHAPVWVFFSPAIARIRPHVSGFLGGSGSVPPADAYSTFAIVLI